MPHSLAWAELEPGCHPGSAGGTEDIGGPLAMGSRTVPPLHLTWGGWAALQLKLGALSVAEGLVPS